jgi:uncharacterized protein (DUF2141 family)
MRLLIFFLVVICSGSAMSADLYVTVQGLRNSLGQLRMALFDQAKQFPRGKELMHKNLAAKLGNIVAKFENLSPGSYALAVHHDANLNEEMDTNFVGLPLEGYGFSNNARVVFSLPTFEAASFDVGVNDTKISLRVVY